MKLALSLVETNNDIAKAILGEIVDHMNTVIDKSIGKIRSGVSNLLRSALKEEPEYDSLYSGQLRLDFGIPDVSVVDDIVNKMADTVDVAKVNIKSNAKGISGGINITAIESTTISNLIDDYSAFVIDSKRGYVLPWLEWLLLRGNSVIIRNYTVEYGPNPNSRTGDAIMVESDQSWRVPAQFTGTVSNNWTTRAISRIENDILQLIQQTVMSNL